VSSLIEALTRQLTAVGPVGRRTPDYSLGAVLLAVYRGPTGLRFLATERRLDMPQHAGQISLPGGGVRVPEEAPAEAALRETREELGVDRDRIRLLGTLGHFPIVVTGWDVVAHLGWWDGIGSLERQESEVNTILEVPIEDCLRQHRERFAGRRYSPQEYPEYFHRQDGQTFRIWGCTGRILHHFFETVYLPAVGSA
jgi:8-oxo-dGTP pyrophosphatase MutT (NUDIX family)